MRRLSPGVQYERNESLFCGTCAARGVTCPGGAGPCHCIWDGADRHRCWDSKPCGVICQDRYDWRRHMENPRLVEAWTGMNAGPPVTRIPAYIPFGTLRIPVRPPSIEWLSLDARDLFYLRDRRGTPRPFTGSPTQIREALGVAGDTKLLVYLNAPDPHLERLWAAGRRISGTLRDIGATLIGAPSFSMFLDRPRMDQIYNLRRMLTIWSELVDEGLTPFPTLYACSEADLQRWAAWLADRPAVWLVGTTVQAREMDVFDDQVNQLVWLQRSVSLRVVPLHVVLHGAGPKRALRARALGLRHFACTSAGPAMVAGRGGKRLVRVGGGFRRVPAPDLTRDQIFALNLRSHAEAFADIPLDPGGMIIPAVGMAA